MLEAGDVPKYAGEFGWKGGVVHRVRVVRPVSDETRGGDNVVTVLLHPTAAEMTLCRGCIANPINKIKKRAMRKLLLALVFADRRLG